MTERNGVLRSRREPPTFLVLSGALVLIVGIGVLLYGAVAIGISYDEPYHVQRLQNWFDHGWYVLPDDLVDGQLGSWVDDGAVYAPMATLALHSLNVLAGQESWGTPSTAPEAYAIRHLGVAMMSLVAVAGAGLLGRLLLRSWRWAVLCAAATVAVPLWTGMSMVNVKDVPVAAGYTLVTVGLVIVVRPGATLFRLAIAVVGVSLGSVLAVGTRPGIWPGIAAAYGITVLALFLWRREGRPRSWLVRVGLVLGSGAASIGLLALTYPSLFADPSWWLRSVFSSANYRGASAPRYEILLLPLEIVPSLLLFITFASWLVAGLQSRPRAWRVTADSAPWLLVLSQAFLVASLAVVKGSQLHGLRQLLFAVPAVAVLAVWGWSRTWGMEDVGRTWGQRLAMGCAALALVSPMVNQVTVFPYSYTYASALVDLSGARTANDYWRASFRELASRVPDGEFIVCSALLHPEGESYARHTWDGGRSPAERSRDCRTDDLSPFGPYRDFDVPVDEPVAGTFLVAAPGNVEVPPRCATVDDVRRLRHFADQRMSVLMRCDLVLFEAKGEQVQVGPDGTGSEFLLGGWTANMAERGVRLLDTRADLGVGGLQRAVGSALVIDLDLSSDVVVDVAADNVEVATLEPGTGLRRIVVPPGWGSVALDGVVLTFRSSGPGEVRLRSFEINPEGSGSK